MRIMLVHVRVKVGAIPFVYFGVVRVQSRLGRHTVFGFDARLGVTLLHAARMVVILTASRSAEKSALLIRQRVPVNGLVVEDFLGLLGTDAFAWLTHY